MVTAVLFVNQATPTTITQFHDLIMNQLPETLPPWEFELSIFLNNKFSRPANVDPKQIPNRYLYTLQLTHLNDEERGNRMISIINNNKSVITCVPNSMNLINGLESFTTSGKNYYYENEEEDEKEESKEEKEEKEENEVKEEGMNEKSESIVHNENGGDFDGDGDVEMKTEPTSAGTSSTDIVANTTASVNLESKSESVLDNDATQKEEVAGKPVDLDTDVDYDLIVSKSESDSLNDMRRRRKLLKHIQSGCCNNLSISTNENLEFMLASKLQSLWTLKQTIRGQGGMGYLLHVQLDEDEMTRQMMLNLSGRKDDDVSKKRTTMEKFRLRTSNCLLHGSFKGFLIEIEHLDDEMEKLRIDNEMKDITDTERKNRLIIRFSRSINMIKSLIATYNFPAGNLNFNVLNDSKLDHMSDLCQQYCDALQF